jgi:Mrp family chromosome partitioning ATPase
MRKGSGSSATPTSKASYQGAATDPEMTVPPGSAPMRLDDPHLLEPGNLHDDRTYMTGSRRVVRRTQQTAGPTVRQEHLETQGVPGPMTGPPLSDDERPKVWIATHKAPPDPDPRLVLLREPDSARSAAFRVMRHRLVDRGDPRVIAVTSAGARDGKTTCAANLALALGELGRAKVLLLEANFRAPQIAVMFGFLPPECFSAQLQRHRDKPLDPWSIVEVFSPSLHVLAVKPGEVNRPLLDAPAFAIAIEMLQRIGYDYIVVDTPPVLGAADANLIEDYVDATVLACRSGQTLGRSLRAAIEQLSADKLLGVALMDG